MSKDNIMLFKASLENCREIFVQSTIKNHVIIPHHFDMIIDSVILSHIAVYYSKVFKSNFFDSTTKEALVKHIYHSNIGKIRNLEMTPSGMALLYPFIYNLFYIDEILEMFATDYKRIVQNPQLGINIINQTINDSALELTDVLQSYENHFKGTGKIKAGEIFFLNCFVHPSCLLNNKSYVLNEHKDEMFSTGEAVFVDLLEQIPIFVNNFLRELKNY